MDIESIIQHELRAVALEQGAQVPATLGRETAVFDTGLDSLGFAILVAQLEERLGFDPFAALAEAYYPATVGEFIDVYLRHRAPA